MHALAGLASAANDRERGCVLVSEMSSDGALTSQEYVKGEWTFFFIFSLWEFHANNILTTINYGFP